MPVGGFVVAVDPSLSDRIVADLQVREDVTLFGADDKGNLIVVLEAATSRLMEDRARQIGRMEGVVSVGVAYINIEDEVEKQRVGEIGPPDCSGDSGS